MNKINKLKKLFAKFNIDGYIISKSDKFFNEFINKNEDRLKFISNFSGSFGIALILKKKNYLFTDGRYITQANKESSKFYTILDISKHSLMKTINKLKIKIGFDPELFKYSFIQKNKNLIPIEKNLVDIIWKRKKENIFNKAYILNENFSGEKSESKINKLKKKLNINNYNIFYISNSENICWLLNLRGKDSPYTPILNSQAILTKNKLIIFCNPKKITKKIKKYYKNNVEFINENLIYKNILKYKKKFIKLDNNTSYKIISFLKENKIKLRFIIDPIFTIKSQKNTIEIQNSKLAHLYDGIALTKFIIWLKTQKKISRISEIIAQKKLEQFRKENSNYLFPSFSSISGLDKNSSIIHYRATEKSNIYFKNNSIYLIDSGGQYKLGTTDITRTISLGKQSIKYKNIYTRILKGHIGVKEFNLSKNSTGKQIDKVARKYLKNINLDYPHGTGHGVGYFLNVHEHPPSISKYSTDHFKSGQIISNEPGYYKPNHFGMRIENLIYVENKNNKLKFNNLTLAPYEKNLINKRLLNKKEIQYINNYHNLIYQSLKAFINSKDVVFLKNYCSPI